MKKNNEKVVESKTEILFEKGVVLENTLLFLIQQEL